MKNIIVLSTLLITVFFSCSEEKIKEPEKKPTVNKVRLDKTALDLALGEKKTLTATIDPASATNQKVSWSSSDKNIATVNENGEVTALKVGQATITVTAEDDSNKTATCTVNVFNVDLNDLETLETTIDGQNGVSIAKYAGNQKDLVLPSVINGKKVLKIESDAFKNKQLTSLTIPDSVTTIGKLAFRNNQLTSLALGNGVKTIGDYAFQNNQLTNITIPDSVTTIEYGAFSNNQLTSLKIPDSVTTIKEEAFSFNQLTSLTIPDSVTTISNSAFSFNQLTSLTIGNRVITIGSWAFDGNSQLKNVTIRRNDKNSLTKIEDNAFAQTPLTDGDPTTQVTITVPKGLINDYQTLWSSKIDSDNGITWKEAP